MFLTNLNIEIVACILLFRIAPQAESGKYFQIWFFPRFRGKKWRRSEHAHASYPGLSFRSPGFSRYTGREERGVQGLDYMHSYRVCFLFWFVLFLFLSTVVRNQRKATLSGRFYF